MKRKLLPLLMSMLSLVASAQVDNYAIRLSPGGSVDCGIMPELNGMDAYTIQFWMNADEWKRGNTLLQRGDGLKVQLGNEGKLNVVLNGQRKTISSNKLTKNTWCQVTLISDGEKVCAYVNGSNVYTSSGKATLPEDNESHFIIGGDEYDGRIDEIRVWNTNLSGDFDMFVHNTLNKWVPQLDNLVAYFKGDQEQCPNLVDYKPLFKKSETNHHGIFSASGAKLEKVTDNTGLPYLLNGAYTDNPRFWDRGIDRDKYLLSNDLIILGIDSYSNGHLSYATACDHGTTTKCELLTKYEGRVGVMQLNGSGSRMALNTTVFSPGGDYTFETWIYLEKWTEGAYIFRRETSDRKHGFSISLGDEDDKLVIVRVNGNKFVSKSKLEVGKWVHFAVSTYNGGTVRNAFLFCYDGKEYYANTTLSDNSTSTIPSGMNDCIAYVGENLTAKLDETAIWNQKFTAEQINNHKSSMPCPGLGKTVSTSLMWNACGYYKYNNLSNLGYDSFSQDEWRNIMTRAYKNYRGYKVRISVRTHDGWQNTIADASRRKIFAQDLATLSEGYDGVELDLEWMDGTQTNLGLLADEILAVLPEGKTLMISCHAYGAYKFPKEKISKVHGFTFQQYGPQNAFFYYSNFTSSYNSFVNYGFPKDKIYLSYSTTTSGPYDENGTKTGWECIGVSWGLMNNNYTIDYTNDVDRGTFDGKYYYFIGPGQTYRRAKFCVDNNLQGIFYWDMGNDMKTNNPYSLAKACSYGLNSNVDTLVTEVTVNHPTPVERIKATESDIRLRINTEEGIVGADVPAGTAVSQMQLYSTTGKLLATATDASRMSMRGLPRGVYVLRVRLQDGTSVSKSFVKP